MRSGSRRIGEAQQCEAQTGILFEHLFNFFGFCIVHDQGEQAHQHQFGMRQALAGNDERFCKVVALKQLETGIHALYGFFRVIHFFGKQFSRPFFQVSQGVGEIVHAGQ